MYGAIVLAAGRSRRMGQDKALLAMGGASFFSEVLAALADARLAVQVLVTNEGLAGTLPREGFDAVVVNPDPESGQLDSLRIGLAALPTGTTGALILLVDNPGALARRCKLVLDAVERAPGRVLAAAYRGVPGHPIWIPTRHFPAIAAWQGADGLRGYLAAAGEPPAPVETSEPGSLSDIDTPEDYKRWSRGESSPA